MKNLPKELLKEQEAKQKQDKGINIVIERKEQNKTIPKAIISPLYQLLLAHLLPNLLKKVERVGNGQGIVSSDLYDNIVANF